MTNANKIVLETVKDAISSGRSFYDAWYYTSEHPQRMLFEGFQDFDRRCECFYHLKLLEKANI